MNLGHVYKDVVVNEFHVKRVVDSFSVSFVFSSSEGTFSPTLVGVRDADSLCEILRAQRLWIEREEDTQLEFGSYTLGVSHEYHVSIYFDALKDNDSVMADR